MLTRPPTAATAAEAGAAAAAEAGAAAAAEAGAAAAAEAGAAAAANDTGAVSGTVTTAPTAAGTHPAASFHTAPRQFRRGRSRPRERPAEKMCIRCGRNAHRDARDCRAAGQTCRYCGKVGHFASVCRGRSARRSRPPAANVDRPQRRSDGGRGVSFVSVEARTMSSPEPATATRCCSGSMLQGLQTRRTPQVQLVLHRTDGRRQQTAWTPDTGAKVSVTSLDEATRMGINVKNLAPPTSSLFTADGRELPCLGSCDIVLQLGDIKRTVIVSVVKKLHSSLLSWHDAVHLGILHREFPQQIRFVTYEAQEGQGSPVGGQETEPRRSRIPRRCKATTSTPSGSTQTKTTLKDLWKPTGVGQGSPVGAQKAGPGRSRIPRRYTGAASKLSGSTQTDTTLKDQRKPTWDDRRTQPSLQEQEKHDAEAEKDFEHQRASLIASLISTAPAEEPEGSSFPSQQKEPLIMEATPTRVFEAVSADYFSWAGRAYLVYADRLSGSSTAPARHQQETWSPVSGWPLRQPARPARCGQTVDPSSQPVTPATSCEGGE